MDILSEYPLIDSSGHRYREVGRHCREYAPTLMTTVGEVPAGTVITKPTPQKMFAAQSKNCPFKNGLYSDCAEDCAFSDDNGGCKLGKPQAGKRCPLPARLTCGDSCMMYHNGRCTVFAAERKKK